MNNKDLAAKIIERMGGSDNITQSWHCITRLRFNVANKEQVKLEEIKQLEGVMGAQFQSGQYQVIIGNEVANVFAEISQLLDGKTANQSDVKPEKNNIIDTIFDVISGIFTPILPAIVGAGLIKGIMALLVAFNLLSPTGSNYEILNFISDASFHFLPFLIAFSAAKKFNTDASLSVALAGILMYPKMMEYAAGGEVTSLKFIGLNIPMNSYASSVLPIILGVWLLSYVHKGANKIVPNSLKIIFTPVLTLLITAPLTLMFIAPLGSTIGVYLEKIFSTLFAVAGPLAGLLMGGLMPLIVITGMHYAFFPGTFASFEKFGYDIMLLPMNLVANLAQAGATLGVFLKTKNTEMKQLSFSTLIPAIFGITEPAIYGVTMKLKKPFYASLIGGAVGGGIFGAFNIKTFAFSVPGITAIPTYIEKGTNNLMIACIGMLASFVVSLIVTLSMKIDTVEEVKMAENNEKETMTKTTVDKKDSPIKVLSPLTGKVLPLSEVPDETFAQELMGKGAAVEVVEGVIRAPFNGRVSMLTPTNHAIGLISEDGVELLIHVGLETVGLKGECFELLVTDGQKIQPGDELIRFDIDRIKEHGLSLISPVIVTNTTSYLDVIYTSDNNVEANKSQLLMLIQ